MNFLPSCSKKKHEKESPAGKSVRLSTRVEKEYLKPAYTASIGEELEDGLFDGKFTTVADRLVTVLAI
jgi:hypothetical protein